MADIDLKVVQESYGFTIGTDGELYGLISGDMGYEKTGIKLDDVSLEIWTLGLAAWEAKDKAHNAESRGASQQAGEASRSNAELGKED